jgi:hypothetical protein
MSEPKIALSLRAILLPNRSTFEPNCLVTNASSAIASSGGVHPKGRRRRQPVAETTENNRPTNVVGADHGAGPPIIQHSAPGLHIDGPGIPLD